MIEHGICRSCGANILWARSAKTNALMPIDPDPVENGNIVLSADGLATTLSGDLWETMHSGLRYISHFATCPNAKEHRKRTRQ